MAPQVIGKLAGLSERFGGRHRAVSTTAEFTRCHPPTARFMHRPGGPAPGDKPVQEEGDHFSPEPRTRFLFARRRYTSRPVHRSDAPTRPRSSDWSGPHRHGSQNHRRVRTLHRSRVCQVIRCETLFLPLIFNSVGSRPRGRRARRANAEPTTGICRHVSADVL